MNTTDYIKEDKMSKKDMRCKPCILENNKGICDRNDCENHSHTQPEECDCHYKAKCGDNPDEYCEHCSPTQPEWEEDLNCILGKRFGFVSDEKETIDVIFEPIQLNKDVKALIRSLLSQQKAELEKHQLYERAAIESSWMQRETVWKANLKIKIEGMKKDPSKPVKQFLYKENCRIYNQALEDVLEVIK